MAQADESKTPTYLKIQFVMGNDQATCGLPSTEVPEAGVKCCTEPYLCKGIMFLNHHSSSAGSSLPHCSLLSPPSNTAAQKQNPVKPS